MSTKVLTRDGVVMAQRYYAGREKGLRVKMYVSKIDYPSFRTVEVAEEGSTRFDAFAKWINAQHSVLEWPTSERGTYEL